MSESLQLIVRPDGAVHCLYDEGLDLAALGRISIRRASHVEPDEVGKWWADLSPCGGPRLGPFDLRSEALQAEQEWLEARLASKPDFFLGSSSAGRSVDRAAPAAARPDLPRTPTCSEG